MSTVMKRGNFIDGEIVRLPLIYNNNVETSANFELPVGAVIRPEDMWLIVTTIDATETISIGIGMSTEAGFDADGFVVTYPLDTAGTYRVADMATSVDGSSQNYLTTYMGVLFWNGKVGANAADQSGIYATKSYRGDGTCKTLCYTCSAGSDTFVGALVFIPRILPFA